LIELERRFMGIEKENAAEFRVYGNHKKKTSKIMNKGK